MLSAEFGVRDCHRALLRFQFESRLNHQLDIVHLCLDKPGPKPESEPELEPEFEPELEPTPEAEGKPEPKPEAKSESEAKPEPDTDPTYTLVFYRHPERSTDCRCKHLD